MIFGEYLVEQNLLRKEDLERALALQKIDRMPLGQLALQQGLISNQKLFRILSRQRKPEDKDKNFGKLAVEMGFLEQEQIESLLERQTHTNRLLGEILVSLGLVAQIDLIKALKRFRALTQRD